VKLYVEVELGNEAMETAEQATIAITSALMWRSSSPASPLNQNEVGSIRDLNGNTVGNWEVRGDG
jgi:hypothetical protein